MTDEKKKKTNGTQTDVEQVEEVLQEAPDATVTLIAQNEELNNKYLRALADYQNLQNRVEASRMQVRQDATVHVLMSLLPFLDNLEAAEVFIKDPGLAMIKNQFAKQLEQMGLQKIEVLNKEFDPHTAEAVDIVQSPQDNIVLEQVRPGYQFVDRVIRPAQVRVGKSK